MTILYYYPTSLKIITEKKHYNYKYKAPRIAKTNEIRGALSY